MIPSPYTAEFEKYSDSFDTYDDFPATTAWLHTIGAAFSKKFSITVKPVADAWEIDHSRKEMRVGSINDVYTRRGVLGLLMNGVGRLLSIKFPSTKREVASFAATHGVKKEMAKHFGALAKTVDEIRTDSQIAGEYPGGDRVVETMHAQAYEAANKAIQAMALDMRVRREMARLTLEWLKNFMNLVKDTAKEHQDSVAEQNQKNSLPKKLTDTAKMLVEEWTSETLQTATDVSLGNVQFRIQQQAWANYSGRSLAVILVALYPQDTDDIVKVLVRAYARNSSLFGAFLSYAPVGRQEEQDLIQFASKIHAELEDVKLFSSHTGGHAQYVIAKAEQYYHAHTLGMEIVTPFGGYDMEARALEVEEANEAARNVAKGILDHGIPKDSDDSLELTRSLLPLLEPFPFLDLNDKKDDKSSNKDGSMGKRLSGAGGTQRPQKRKKEREKKSSGERAKDRKKMESMDNKKNQKEVDQQRGGYSILGDNQIDQLKKYLYLIGPYLGRIQATAARMRRILKVNDPSGLRGAYSRGKALNPRILYRHRLDDYRLFARKEVEKDQSYGFAVMADLSGSTAEVYGNSNRQIQDEMLAAAFLMAEVAERIGDKVMCSVGFFANGAQTVKRPAFYLNRAKITGDISEHDGGTNVEAAGMALEEDLQEMSDFKVKGKTIVFITDGSFDTGEFLQTVKAAKKHDASIAYFQISGTASSGVQMCKRVEKFVTENAKGVRVRTRNVTTRGIDSLPEAMAQLMKETIGATER